MFVSIPCGATQGAWVRDEAAIVCFAAELREMTCFFAEWKKSTATTVRRNICGRLPSRGAMITGKRLIEQSESSSAQTA